MRLIKEIAFAATLSVVSIFNIAPGHAHEIKFGNLVIGHPWSRQSPMGAKVAAGFMTITNSGAEDDRLVGATAQISTNVQIHDMKMENGMMQMFELADGIVVPAGETVQLKPKSLHIMFIDIKAPLMEGTEFKGTLTFEKAGTVDIDYEVAAPDAGMN